MTYGSSTAIIIAMNKQKLVAPILLLTSIAACLYAETFKPVEIQSPYISHSFKVYALEVGSTSAGQPDLTEQPWKSGLTTAYSCGGLKTTAEIKMNCPSLLSGKPHTANGSVPVANETMACDKANMGKQFEIKGLGVRTCTDTGSAITGAGRFDLYVEDVQTAWQWGRQTIEYREVR